MKHYHRNVAMFCDYPASSEQNGIFNFMNVAIHKLYR